ncbi:hypothetical protein BVG19_g244 [[Candida] boidinii]|nr:hypothetical protein BVG19_g244 [[Candida] boidinii]OWB49771.1 hypothetical protein B5S27_g1315 [[Candida] boidinii]OWB68161.1 hypothetical protein B5S30_g3535 [[Candida] boidinii]OWB82480.1 hypothetical protein B5S33_g1106 [[Candida] boidinii]
MADTMSKPRLPERPVGKSYAVYEKADFYLDQRYKVYQVLGKGSYGTVCSAKDLTNEEDCFIAIKKLNSIFNKEVLLKRAVRELKLMNFFKGHRNIVNLVDLDIVNLKPYDGLYCFQELVEYDLAKVIHSSVQLSEYHIQSFLYQILCGVLYIHSADVIHRDLKPGNILINSQGVLKICDFGLARGINSDYLKHNHKSSLITNYVATRWYRAPELMLCKRSYGKEVDMWAVGCIFVEFYGRRPIFIGNDQVHQLIEILKVLGTPSKDVVSSFGSSLAWDLFNNKLFYKKVEWKDLYPFAENKYAYEIMDKLLCWDPAERYTVEECLANPFLKTVRNPNEEAVKTKPFDFTFEWRYSGLHELNRLLRMEVDSFKANSNIVYDFDNPN